MSNRREFIKKATALSATALLSHWAVSSGSADNIGEVLPLRRITRDGTKSTAFALGGYHHAKSLNPAQAEQLLEKSMELGVRFYDNARGYHQGVAEEYYGRFLTPKYRKEIFLMTKSHARTAEGVKEHLSASLSAMKTDYVDLWQIHNLMTVEDVDNRIKAGVVDFFLEAKDQGKARYIGFSCHTNPKVGMYFLEQLEARGLQFDTCQMPLNVCDPGFESFRDGLLPALVEREYGVIAMKTMGGGGMLGRRFDLTPKDYKDEEIPDIVQKTELTTAQLHQFVYSMPISTLCSGCETIDELENNVKVLRNFKDLKEEQLERYVSTAKPFAGKYAECYKRVL
ncbi:MAG: aldo/keto reductase [Cyclobacteriaceae bacterium]|nr:aldo/keto reductase [Cyclobacteriaceae bacterium]